jgi:hypothetical protein
MSAVSAELSTPKRAGVTDGTRPVAPGSRGATVAITPENAVCASPGGTVTIAVGFGRMFGRGVPTGTGVNAVRRIVKVGTTGTVGRAAGGVTAGADRISGNGVAVLDEACPGAPVGITSDGVSNVGRTVETIVGSTGGSTVDAGTVTTGVNWRRLGVTARVGLGRGVLTDPSGVPAPGCRAIGVHVGFAGGVTLIRGRGLGVILAATVPARTDGIGSAARVVGGGKVTGAGVAVNITAGGRVVDRRVATFVAVDAGIFVGTVTKGVICEARPATCSAAARRRAPVAGSAAWPANSVSSSACVTKRSATSDRSALDSAMARWAAALSLRTSAFKATVCLCSSL